MNKLPLPRGHMAIGCVDPFQEAQTKTDWVQPTSAPLYVPSYRSNEGRLRGCVERHSSNK